MSDGLAIVPIDQAYSTIFGFTRPTYPSFGVFYFLFLASNVGHGPHLLYGYTQRAHTPSQCAGQNEDQAISRLAAPAFFTPLPSSNLLLPNFTLPFTCGILMNFLMESVAEICWMQKLKVDTPLQRNIECMLI